MKQTAVDWLIEKITNRQNGVFDGLPYLSVDEIYNQAKEMEKQQIIDAYNEGGCNWDSELEAEQYYNDTFREIEKL
jgi:2-iminoacetate synthase ThiH